MHDADTAISVAEAAPSTGTLDTVRLAGLAHRLQLVDSQATTKGVILAKYRPADQGGSS